MDVLIERILPHKPDDVYGLFMDLKNYPTFIPEIAAVHVISTVQDEEDKALSRLKTEAWIEAKNLSLKVKSTVETKEETRRIDVFYHLGPLRVAHAEIDFEDTGAGTKVRLHVVAKLVPKIIRQKIIGRLDEMTDRYTAVFEERCQLKLDPYTA